MVKETMEKGSACEHIIPLDKSLKFKPVSAVVTETLRELEQARFAGRRCSGRIIAVREMTDKDGESVVCASVLYNGCISVVIPVDRLVDARIYPTRGDKRSRDRMLIEMRQGAEIDFLITQVFEVKENPLNSLVLGDRVTAMKQIRGEDLVPGADGRAFINAGDVVEARVTFVADRKIGVEVRGFETILNNGDITYDYHASLKEAYQPGDQIPLRILSVQMTADKDIAGMKLDGKDIGIDNRDIALVSLPVGTVVPCIVTGISPDAVYVECLYAPWTIRCRPPKHFDPPLMRERVTVRIDRTDPVKKRLYGLIESKHGFARGISPRFG